MRMLCRLAALAALFVVPGVLAQGPLTPPGAPAPTMKTLEQIEPRIPITNLPITLSAPGSYYLTGNLTGVTTNGITIASDDVSIDLEGFAIEGVAGSARGITDDLTIRRNIRVRNGTIRNWGDAGVNLNFSRNSFLEDLRSLSNGASGLVLGRSGVIRNCAAEGNAGTGIITPDHRCVILSSAATRNGGRGIHGGVATTIGDCTATENAGHGLYAGFGSVVRGCTAAYNGTNGIYADTGTTVTDCSATFNGQAGIYGWYKCAIERCTASQNTGDGIAVVGKCRVVGNTVGGYGAGSSPAGIRVSNSANRVEGNLVTDCTLGIQVQGASNLIVRNSASLNTTNFDIAPGNAYGPIVNVAGVGNITAVTNAVHPWANFEF